MTTTRREFLSGIMHGALVPVVVGLGSSACSDGSTPGDSLRDGGPTECSSIGARVTFNHGHTIEVPLADVEAGNSKTYTVVSNGSHSHTVLVTAEQFAALATGTMVTATTSLNSGHMHGVEITCVMPT